MAQLIILGIIQGLTEFLPVSSSGHLVILQSMLGFKGDGVALPIVLHLGTALALVIFFFKELLGLLRNLRLLGLILLVTLITGIIGLSAKDFFESLFANPRIAAFSLIATGIILLSTKKFQKAQKSEVRVVDALILGFTQAVAIIPGISRSGITISALLFRKIDRRTAFDFSFLAAIPAISGAALLEAGKLESALKSEFSGYLAGFLASLITGLSALAILKWFLAKAKFHYFGYYCILVAILTLIFL